MKASASIELVWQLAAREAVAADFKEIEPEHVFAALLKFAELPADELARLGEGSDAVSALSADVKAVRDELKARAIDGTRLRRSLRAQLGRGESPFQGGMIHRSEASRRLFDAAARVAAEAGRDTLTAWQLLDALLASPPSKAAELLGGATLSPAAGRSNTPLLDAAGRDLTRLAAEGALEAVKDRQPECRALLQILAQEARKSVFLLTDREDPARAVVLAVAGAVAGNDAPQGLRGRRIIDVTALAGDLTGPGDAGQSAAMLFAEASAAREVILWLPPIEAGHGALDPEEWLAFLKVRLTGGAVQCVCRVALQAYEQWVKKDPSWRRRVEVMHVHHTKLVDLPDEL